METTTNTPAPTLEELPPQKGTILELHSINEDFNGKLVEFLKEDAEYMGESDKIYVRLLEDEEQSLRVKVVCCRRPDIKPLELRRLLHSLSRKIIDEGRESETATEADETRIKSFLEKDPCCAFAHEALAWIGLLGDESFKESGYISKEGATVVVKHFRRAAGSLYAYRDLLSYPEAYKQNVEMHISQYLTKAGHEKSAIRMHPRVLNPSDPNCLPRVLVRTEFYAGLAFKNKADKLNDQEQLSRKCNKYMEAVPHFLRAVSLVRNKVENGDTVDSNTLQYTAQSIRDTHSIFECFSDRESKTHGDESLILKKSMLKIAEDLLKACTGKYGAVHFLKNGGDDECINKTLWLEKAETLRLELAEHGQEE